MSILYSLFIENWVFFSILLIVFILYFKIRIGFNKYSEHREFAKTESPIEEFLFQELRKRTDYRDLPYEVYTQVSCGSYRIDLALYTKRGRIAIECDGKEFHSSFTQVKHDEKKDKYLKQKGWHVFRFSGSEIYRARKGCVDEIEQFIHSKGIFKKKTAHMR